MGYFSVQIFGVPMIFWRKILQQRRNHELPNCFLSATTDLYISRVNV